MSRTILVVDDELQLIKNVRLYLEEAGYRVITATNGRDAVFMVRQEHPDAIIMDVMMPEMDGFTAARQIRSENNLIPILLLTAKDDEFDQALGLELGADDYIIKPFSPRVLVARLRAALRRVSGEASTEPTIYRIGSLVLNLESHSVYENDQEITVTHSEFDLLATLMARPGRVFTRMELLERIHGEAFAAYERTIDVHIKNLRNKLSKDLIETVYGVGYRMRDDE